MNIIEYLMEKTARSIITIEKYDLADLANSYSIRFLVDNESIIKDYFNNKVNFVLEDGEAYYDFQYLKYVIKFQDHLDEIPREYGEPLRQLIVYAKEKTSKIDTGQIIKCIQKNYLNIFELAKRFTDMGLMNETLDFVIKYYSGFENCGLMEFLITDHTYFVFDNFEKLYGILRKNTNELLKVLMITNLHSITRMRFKDICDLIKVLYHKNITDIARESSLILFDSIMKRYEEKEDEFFIQNDLKSLYHALYFCKMGEAKELIPIIKEIDDRVENRIMNEGHEISHKIPIHEFRDWMEKIRSAPALFRFLNLSHSINNEDFWISRIDEFSSSFTPNLYDVFSNSPNTNDYFSRSRKKYFDFLITCYSSKLLYWFSDKELTSEFKESFSTVVTSILEVVNYNTEFENIHDDIDCFAQILSEAIEKNENGISLFTKLMYIISFFEKFLRMVYIALDEKIFFEKNITLGAVFGQGDNINRILINILGEHHLRWTRYYLLKDDEKVGLDYRNRMAHLRDITPSDMSIFEFLKVIWIIISTINTLLVNLINDDHIEVKSTEI